MAIQANVHTLFEAQVERIPFGIAVLSEGHSLTYNEINKKANQLAHYLRKNGLQTGDHIAVCMDRSTDCLISMLAILKAGGAYVPLDASQPEDRLLFILKDNNTQTLIITSSVQAQFTHYHGNIIALDLDAKKIDEHATFNPNVPITEKHLAYVIYTSGSTGTPKGVLIEHGSVVNYSRWFAEYCHCKPQQLIDFSSNYIFDMAVTTSIVSLALGLTLVICKEEVRTNFRQYLTHLKNNKINTIKITPSYFNVLLHEVKNKRIALPHLERIILGGENLPTTDCAAWLAIYPKHILFNEYGPTEATVAVSHYRVCKKNVSTLGTIVPIGKPGPNMICHILNKDHAEVCEGEIGELYISGICLAQGYLNQPELTKKQFIIDPVSHLRLYKTGDLCRRQVNGTIECLGRADAQVKIRGFRIEPGEIEKRLSQHPAIHAVSVHAIEIRPHEKQLVAYYILNETAPTSPSVSELRQHLQQFVPDYMIPTAFVRMDTFPLTANGKLDLAVLPPPLLTTNQHYIAPTTLLEKKLALIWSEELGVKSIGLDDDFFELGGHSLSAARIVSKIIHTLKKEIHLNDFYSASTIGKLAKKINHVKNVSEDKTPIQHSKHLPLSDFQLMLWISNTFEPKTKKLNIIGRKRLQGQLDMSALRFAFNTVLKKHDILLYRALKFRPMQRLQKNTTFNITEKNFEGLSVEASELALEASINSLLNHYPWHKNAPMLIARLFHMADHVTELQICMPHIVSDDVSPEILFEDLSRFYDLYQNQASNHLPAPENPYRHYIVKEQHHVQQHIKRDIQFWETYLKDACVLQFPTEYIVKDMKSKGLAYSTYLKVPEEGLSYLQRFCANHHVSFHDGLCAALTLALLNCCGSSNTPEQPIFMNRVKSARDNPNYDDVIGCFLRLEPIKIHITKESTLETLSKQVHQSSIDTSLYQQCSGLIKFACISTFCQERSLFGDYLIDLFTFLYTRLFPTPTLNRKMLNLCKLSSFERNNQFFINMNVNSNFLSDDKMKQEPILFGFKTKKTHIISYDLISMDYLFDICFLRDEDQNTPYLVISANLQPAFRERIAKEVIRVISSAPLTSLEKRELEASY